MSYVLGAKESSSRSGIQLAGFWNVSDWFATGPGLRDEAQRAIDAARREGRYTDLQWAKAQSDLIQAYSTMVQYGIGSGQGDGESQAAATTAGFETMEAIRDAAQTYNKPKGTLEAAVDTVSKGLGSGLFWGGILLAGTLAWKLSR